MSIFEYDEERHMQQEREGYFAAGETSLGTLISRLLSENRIADAQRASTDAVTRRELYEEFGITR